MALIGNKIPCERYPPLSLAVAGSHDLPTLIAWMTASDLALKDELKLFPSARLKEEAQRERLVDRQKLMAAFKELGLPSDSTLQLDQFAAAAHAFLASSSSAITMVQIDDITQETTPVNVPATSTEHPNWRRRLSMSLEEIAGDARFRALTRLLNDTCWQRVQRGVAFPLGVLAARGADGSRYPSAAAARAGMPAPLTVVNSRPIECAHAHGICRHTADMGCVD
jgi:hypothetical protein